MLQPVHARPDAGLEITTEEVWRTIRNARIDGISFSGGEPFQQPEALLDLARRSREAGLSVLIFSGYPREAIERLPDGRRILAVTDVLVDGRYVPGLAAMGGFVSSTNQQIHLLTDRHSEEDFVNLPRSEIILHRDGSITLTGVKPIAGARIGRSTTD